MNKLIFVSAQTEQAIEATQLAKKILVGVEGHVDHDIIMAVGGDGTMLQAVRSYADNQDALFVGISAGHLGLLQTIEVAQLTMLGEALRAGTYSVIKSPLLGASFCQPVNKDAASDEVQETLGYAFNDISVERQSARAAKFHLHIDGSKGTFIGDGIVFATPLGSTAYSLAAGGPIIDSEVQNVFVATPNNPHGSSLYSSLQRPHVFHANRKVRIELNPDDIQERPVQVVLDGQTTITDINRPISIYLSHKTVKLLQLEPEGLQSRIMNKRLGRL